MDLKKYSVKNKFKEDIEAEEIFLDAEAIRSIETKGKLERPIKKINFIILYLVILLGLAGLLARSVFLQVVRGDYYQDLAKGTRVREYAIVAPRGVVYDRFFERLVYNEPAFDLVVDLADFWNQASSTKIATLKEIAGLVSVSDATKEELDTVADEFIHKIDKERSQANRLFLVRGMERDRALVAETLVGNWVGVRLEKNVRRQYNKGEILAHIIGYTGEISQGELSVGQDYDQGDQIGKGGLELQYESILRGQNGYQQVQIDSLGRIQNLIGLKQPIPGNSLLLHLNYGLQAKFFELFEESFKALARSGVKTNKAVAVAIDPNSGGVLAMVSLPSFDGNLFAEGISKNEFSELQQRSDKPFLNRALAGQYPSGSVIKPVIAAAALNEKVIRPDQTIDCKGAISVGNYLFPDWTVHGVTDVVKAIAQSCDVFFYAAGGGYGDIKGLGVSRIGNYLKLFGFGQSTGIDLPYEEGGLVPDPEWKKARDGDWYLGDTYHLSIGQGDILVTPIQMAVAIATVANGGTLYEPQIVDKILNSDRKVIEDIQPQAGRTEIIPERYLSIVRRGMREAVLSGSARSLGDLSVQVAGKTGTAQFGTDAKTHAWFVGFAPYDKPEIVVVVLIEGGGEGSSVAVPVAHDALLWYFENKR